FLYCDRITKAILPFIERPKEPGELLPIACIKLIVLIDAPSIFDGFNDRDALIRLKRDDPEAQKLLRLHHIDRAPHRDLQAGSRVKGFESGAREQFDL